jgi:Neuraminidase (sialidase)
MGGAEASPKAVIAALAAKKVKVTATQVSNVKSYLKNGPPGRKAKRKSARFRRNGADLISIRDLQAAKRLVDALGSTDAATAALAVLARLS